MTQWDTQAAQIKQRRALQEAFMQRVMQPKAQASPWTAIADIGTALMMRNAGDKLDAQELDVGNEKSEAQRNMLANILAQPDRRSMIEAGAASPFPDDLSLASALSGSLYPTRENIKLGEGDRLYSPDMELLAENAKPSKPQNLMQVDRNDAIELVDPVTGNLVRQLPKGATPGSKRLMEVDRGDVVDILDESGNVVKSLPKGRTPDQEHAAKKDQRTFETGLRDKFLAQAKTFTEVRDAHNRIVESSKEKSGAGDIGVVFSYMKLLDPQSTVMKGEYAEARNSAGVPDTVRNLYNRVIQGDKLGEEGRNGIVKAAKQLYAAQEKDYLKLEREFSRLAQQNEADPKNVIVDLRSDQTADQASPVQTPGAPRRQARDKKTGEMAEFEQRNGKWVRVK